MSTFNRLATAKNSYQGPARKVLCICSAGLLRSPTVARVLAGPPFNYNTRAVGMSQDFALIPVDDVLLHWADELVFMEEHHRQEALTRFPSRLEGMCQVVLNIQDNYPYMHPDLITLIIDRYPKDLIGN